MALMTMKEKVENILGGFLERNKDYAISGYIKDGGSGCIIANFIIPIDREIKINEKKFILESNMNDIKCANSITIPYDEVLACYEERDEYNQQMAYVILKNGMVIDFECIGMKI